MKHRRQLLEMTVGAKFPLPFSSPPCPPSSPFSRPFPSSPLPSLCPPLLSFFPSLHAKSDSFYCFKKLTLQNSCGGDLGAVVGAITPVAPMESAPMDDDNDTWTQFEIWCCHHDQAIMTVSKCTAHCTVVVWNLFLMFTKSQ